MAAQLECIVDWIQLLWLTRSVCELLPQMQMPTLANGCCLGSMLYRLATLLVLCIGTQQLEQATSTHTKCAQVTAGAFLANMPALAGTKAAHKTACAVQVPMPGRKTQ